MVGFLRSPAARLVLIPLFFVVWQVGHVLPAKGFYFQSADPNYMYLFNALNIADGAAPWHVDNPGSLSRNLAPGFFGLPTPWLAGVKWCGTSRLDRNGI